MKKLFCMLFLSPFLFLYAGAESIIIEDFYLNNRSSPSIDVTDAINVLPNTLRLTLAVGERRELYADIFPQDASATALFWSLEEGKESVQLLPEREKCAVIGLSAGNGKIKIKSEGGAEAEVDVEVTAPKEPRLRSFEAEPIKKESFFSEKLMRLIIRLLIIFGASAILFSVISFVKRRSRKR